MLAQMGILVGFAHQLCSLSRVTKKQNTKHTQKTKLYHGLLGNNGILKFKSIYAKSHNYHSVLLTGVVCCSHLQAFAHTVPSASPRLALLPFSGSLLLILQDPVQV